MYKFLQPRGFRIYFGDDDHLVRFYFYGNMNEPFNESNPESTEPQMFSILINQFYGFWVYQNRFVEFGPNDTLYYFIKGLAKDGSYAVSNVYRISKYKNSNPTVHRSLCSKDTIQ